MKLTNLLALTATLFTLHTHAQMHIAFEYQMGTMTGHQPGPWTKFENPAIQSFWINGQRGYVLNQQEAESVKHYLNEAAAYRNINTDVKLEVEKIIQYFSADNNQREKIKDFIPADLRPLPLPKGVNADNVNNALDPMWKTVNDDNLKGASEALEDVRERMKKLSEAERSYTESELNRLFTYPSGQLKNLPHLPTNPVHFNAPVTSLKIKPFVRALNDLQVNEAELRKELAPKSGIGARVQKEVLKIESGKIKRALKIEEFKSHYFNTPTDFPREVSATLENSADKTGLLNEAERIIQQNPRIHPSISEGHETPDETLMHHTAELSSCLARGVSCGTPRDIPGAGKDIQEVHKKISKLYETHSRSEKISDPAIKNLSQNLVNHGHNKVLSDAGDSQFYVDLATSVTDIGLGFVPVVGTAKDFIEFVTGKSLLTGESLDVTSRAIMATAVVIDLASFGTGGRLTKVALEGAVNSFRTFAQSRSGVQIGKHWDDVEAFTQEVFERVEHYKFDNPVVAKGYAKLHEGLKTLPSKFKIYDVKEGVSNGKIAVVGRKMVGGVNDVADHLKKHLVEVETFRWSDDAKENWKEVKKLYQNERIPYEKVIDTLGYRENKEWAERIVREGYTIFDIRDPLGANVTEGFSAFYDIENIIIWGRLNP